MGGEGPEVTVNPEVSVLHLAIRGDKTRNSAIESEGAGASISEGREFMSGRVVSTRQGGRRVLRPNYRRYPTSPISYAAGAASPSVIIVNG